MKSSRNLADKAMTDPINLTKEEIGTLYKDMPLVAQGGVWENVLELRKQAAAKGKL